MDNASRALIMAATVILAMMILGTMVYLFRAGADMNKAYDEKQVEESLQLYNSKFDVYNREDNNIMDIITVCNLAYDTNIDSDYDNGIAVEIIVDCKAGKKFTIPRISGTNIARNSILINGEGDPISIYELSETPNVWTNTPGTGDEKLSKCEIIDNAIYKYLFKCTNVQFSGSTGKIIGMEFEMYENGSYPDSE